MPDRAADDFPTISARLREIEAERNAALSAPCPACTGAGWVWVYGELAECQRCGNPNGLGRPT